MNESADFGHFLRYKEKVWLHHVRMFLESVVQSIAKSGNVMYFELPKVAIISMIIEIIWKLLLKMAMLAKF